MKLHRMEHFDLVSTSIVENLQSIVGKKSLYYNLLHTTFPNFQNLDFTYFQEVAEFK